MRGIDVKSEPREVIKVLIFKAYSSAIVKWYRLLRISLDFLLIDLKYKCNSEKIMTHKAARVIMGVVTQP